MIIRFLALALFKILFRLQASGLKNVPLKGGFILVANHTSYLDPPVIAAACPRVLSFLAKEELFKNALFGRFISGLNAFPVKTHSGDIKALRRAIKILQQGEALLIFPEGGRFNDGRLHKPLEGVGLMAAKAGVPVVPAFIQGSNRALPMNSKLIRLKKVKVYFGKALSAEEIEAKLKEDNPYQRIAEMAIEEIGQLKNRSSSFEKNLERKDE